MASWQHRVPRVLPPPARPRSPHTRSRHPPNGSRYSTSIESTLHVRASIDDMGTSFYPVSVAALAERHAATLVFEEKPGTVKGSLPFIPQFGCCIFFSGADPQNDTVFSLLGSVLATVPTVAATANMTSSSPSAQALKSSPMVLFNH